VIRWAAKGREGEREAPGCAAAVQKRWVIIIIPPMVPP
jgi:hypothetical protein